MIETIRSQSLASYIKEIKKTDPPGQPAVIIPVKTRTHRLYHKQQSPLPPPELCFDKWTMPAEQGGYIKCGKHDFL
jgi:hypothetical protein